LKKSGYSIYQHPRLKSEESGYGLIIDESIMLGNQRMILILGVKSDKRELGALDYSDIEIIGIHVDTSWNAEKIEEILVESEENRVESRII
jgi:hypothetical protein